MENTEKNTDDYYDLLHIFKKLWHRAWLIILAGVLTEGAGFTAGKFASAPKYSSHIMLYVNNSSSEMCSAGLSSHQTVFKKDRGEMISI